MTDIIQKVLHIKEICLAKGQSGLIELTEKFDGVALDSFKYEIPRDIEIDDNLQDAIKTARANIYKFHKAEYDKLQSFENDKIETMKGVICWKRFTAIESAGIYIPGRLFSSALMNIIPAQIAGCENIAVCTPPNPSKEILWVLRLLGVKTVYMIGGAQAVFALAYGIGEIPKVDKIFGPGNEFVDVAKRMISDETAIDMPAGPSEVLVILEGRGYDGIVYDLLAQLEHGKESKAWLFCTDSDAADFVKRRVRDIAAGSLRWHILKHSLENLVIQCVSNVEEAIGQSNIIAPEHLILNVFHPEMYIDKIKNAGSVFLGKHTPESLGDYISGTNHVLPTSGFSKAFSGLSVLSFGKFTTFQTATGEGLGNAANKISVMANAEGLEFHAKSVNRGYE